MREQARLEGESKPKPKHRIRRLFNVLGVEGVLFIVVFGAVALMFVNFSVAAMVGPANHHYGLTLFLALAVALMGASFAFSCAEHRRNEGLCAPRWIQPETALAEIPGQGNGVNLLPVVHPSPALGVPCVANDSFPRPPQPATASAPSGVLNAPSGPGVSPDVPIAPTAPSKAQA